MKSYKKGKVFQIDLARLQLLKTQARHAQKDYDCYRRSIIAALEHGARVESGPYHAEVLVTTRLLVE